MPESFRLGDRARRDMNKADQPTAHPKRNITWQPPPPAAPREHGDEAMPGHPRPVFQQGLRCGRQEAA